MTTTMLKPRIVAPPRPRLGPLVRFVPFGCRAKVISEIPLSSRPFAVSGHAVGTPEALGRIYGPANGDLAYPIMQRLLTKETGVSDVYVEKGGHVLILTKGPNASWGNAIELIEQVLREQAPAKQGLEIRNELEP